VAGIEGAGMVTAQDAFTVCEEVTVQLFGFCVPLLVLDRPPDAAAEFETFLVVIAQDPPLVVVERAEHRLCFLETAQPLHHSS
jgi:hypothetical protein